jgi:tRNA (adenine57-N1/adenine58-N1)-methyltransferase
MYLLVDEKGNTYMVKGESDLHTKYGKVSASDIGSKSLGGYVESHIGHRFAVISPSMVDFIQKAKRGPQAVTLKDMGIIAAYTGIRTGSRVVEAGTGSGVLSLFIANIVHPENLVTYEVREDFASIADFNFKKAGVDNVTVKMGSIYDGIEETDLDVVILDLPEPWRVTEHAKKALRPGGYLVSYSPSIEQTKKFTDTLSGFRHDTIECVLREWDTRVLRPHSRMIAHTGFITIARFLGNDGP